MASKTLHTYLHEDLLSRSIMVADIARELELRDEDEIPEAAHIVLAAGPFYRLSDAELAQLYGWLCAGERQVVEREGVWYAQRVMELNEGHYFEALDRSHVLMCSYSDFVDSHPAVQAHPEIAERASAALEAMMDVYQAVGAKMPWGD